MTEIGFEAQVGTTSRHSEDDLRKSPQTRRAKGSTGRAVDASSTFFAGTADAFAEGWRAFSEKGPTDRMGDPTLNNSWLHSTIHGYASFFDRLAETSRSVLEDLQSRRPEDDEPATATGTLVTSANVPSAQDIAEQVVLRLKTDPEFISAVGQSVAMHMPPPPHLQP